MERQHIERRVEVAHQDLVASLLAEDAAGVAIGAFKVMYRISAAEPGDITRAQQAEAEFGLFHHVVEGRLVSAYFEEDIASPGGGAAAEVVVDPDTGRVGGALLDLRGLENVDIGNRDGTDAWIVEVGDGLLDGARAVDCLLYTSPSPRD